MVILTDEPIGASDRPRPIRRRWKAMDNEEFRRYGHQVVDWIGDYLEDIRQYPV